MKKVLLGVFAALAIACSSSSSTNGPGDAGHDGSGSDTLPGTDGGGDDTRGGSDTHHDVSTDVPGDVAVCPENTVGKTCAKDTDCDPCGTTANVCAVNVLPTSVCVSLSSAGGGCDPGDGTKIVACDNADGTDRGICLQGATAGAGDCFPACSWKDGDAAVAGCQGKDHCNWISAPDPTKLGGTGYCFQGCKADADCGTTTGSSTTKCDVFTGLCQKTLPAYTLKVGDPCTYKTTGTQDCACFAAAATNKGYCSQFCDVGDTTCGTGFTCSAFLPSKCASGAALYTKTPTGMAGNCLKTCTTDADCTTLNSTCQDTVEGKLCVPFNAGSGC